MMICHEIASENMHGKRAKRWSSEDEVRLQVLLHRHLPRNQRRWQSGSGCAHACLASCCLSLLVSRRHVLLRLMPSLPTTSLTRHDSLSPTPQEERGFFPRLVIFASSPKLLAIDS